ncbi:MAG: radical SAM protein [Lachnospiraceae bacterium]|nr:radical SAM protein [Lachnospiraceae bacterium]
MNLKQYMRENFTEVRHTTLNPKGPGAVRIHLIPPKFDDNKPAASVAIINGQDIIPVNYAWSVLLAEFINEVNKYHGREVSDEDVSNILNATCKNVKKVFPVISKKRIKADIRTMMETFEQVAYGKEVTTDIGYMNIGEYSEHMKAPHRMDIMVSAMEKQGHWNCNQCCVHCYAAGQTDSAEPELTTEQWKKILDSLKEIGIPQVTFTGGEPTMRDDLFELIDHARWFISRLNTNGIKLTKEYCKKLHDCELDSVQITFYSHDRETHNRLVGGDHFDETVSGIENALEAGISLSVNTPLCTLNKDYTETLKFLKSKGVTYVTCSGLITTGNALKENSEALQLSTEEINKVLAEATDYAYANGMEISFTSPGWIEGSFFEAHALNTPSCGACLSNMAITPGGNVVPCQSWLSGKPLGNILKDSWESIWNNEECIKHRKHSALMNGDCPLKKPAGSAKTNNEGGQDK